MYKVINEIKDNREMLGKMTFILSLTHDVGPVKDDENGFSIPMFPIKEKTMEFWEAKENGNDPWKSFYGH